VELRSILLRNNSIGEVPLGVGYGQQTRKIFILHIDDYERSFHGSLPLVALVLVMAGADHRALPGTRSGVLRHAWTRRYTRAQTVHPGTP
jgi:hypothetical protein